MCIIDLGVFRSFQCHWAELSVSLLLLVLFVGHEHSLASGKPLFLVLDFPREPIQLDVGSNMRHMPSSTGLLEISCVLYRGAKSTPHQT